MRTSALAVLAMVVATAVQAQWRLFEPDPDEKPWSEIEAQLPPYPKTQDMIPFDAGAATAHRFFIDAPSLSVGEDGVVRYTLIIRTAGGSTNVSYEGIRCESRELKYYAAGRGDGKWAPARDPQWRYVEAREVNRHHNVLYAEFFCPDRSKKIPTAKQIVEALKRSGAGLR